MRERLVEFVRLPARRVLRSTNPIGLLCVVLALGMHGVPAVAQVSRFEVLVEPPVAIRGSELVIPLGLNARPLTWPKSLPARVGGRKVTATLCWLVPSFSAGGSWARPAQPVEVRDAQFGGEQNGAGRPVAILPLPVDADGAVELLGRTWTPTWREPQPELTGPPLAIPSDDARPSDTDPFEYFRWVLMAELAGATPPPPGGQPLAQRIARSIAAEWRSGLARIGQESPGVAAEIRERLVALVKDSMRPFDDQHVAGWITGARDLTTLRSILIDPVRTDREAMQAGLAWLDSQPAFQAWFESTAGDQVRIAVMNPTDGELVLSSRWLGAAGPPIGMALPPGSLTRHTIARPVLELDAEPPLNEQLTLETETGQVLRLDAGRRAFPVRPPGAVFEPVLLPLALAQVSGGFRDAATTSETTSAVLRRRFDRWELFIECFRPRPESPDRLLIQFGDPLRPVAVLEVGSDGGWQIRRGSEERTLQVAVRGFEDRWRCQVVLPEPWLVDAITSDSGGAVLIGFRRDGPGDLRQFAGLASPPWRSDIASLAFDLTSWEDGVSDSP